jgi:DNA-binding CsgD family transcriptional regulator
MGNHRVSMQTALRRVPMRPDEVVLRSMLAALLSAVRAPVAFVCLARESGRPCDLAREVDGQLHQALVGPSLNAVFGLRGVARGSALSILTTGDEGTHASAEYWRTHSSRDGLARALVVSLHDTGGLFGYAGVERRAEDPSFTRSDLDALEMLTPLLLRAGHPSRHSEERSREVAALRAIGDVRGAVLVVDCEERRLVSVSPPESRLPWTASSKTSIRSLVKAVTSLVLTPSATTTRPPFRVGGDVVLSVVPIVDGGTDAPRYAAVHLGSAEGEPTASEKLSRREREVAKLLVEGYSNVNIAALCGLSPNTVRTFMRRVYVKLGVFNRADLVRELVRRPLA